MRGGGANIGATGFPTPPPAEEEAPPIIRETPPPPPPPEEQPITPDPEPEPEPEVEEEPVESRHVDQEEAGTPDMIVYSGKFTYGEMGGGIIEANEKSATSAERTRNWRLIQEKQNNIYRIEVDGHQMVNEGSRNKPKWVIKGPGIYGFRRVARGNQPGGIGNRIGTLSSTAAYTHTEKDLQDLIALCEDNTKSDHVARLISGALRGELGRMGKIKAPKSGAGGWTAPGEPYAGGRFG